MLLIGCDRTTAQSLAETVGSVARLMDGDMMDGDTDMMDVDTVKLTRADGSESTIRLEGIDAPECRSAPARIGLLTDAG